MKKVSSYINRKNCSKLTCSNNDVWIVDSEYHQKNEAWGTKQLTSYPLTTYIEANLLAVLMMSELFIHNNVKQSGVWYKTAHKLSINKKHWNKLINCIDDVWIVNSKYHQWKKCEIWNSSQVIYALTTNTEVNLPTVCIENVWIVNSQYY